jgi:hypothetical protein
MALAIPTVYPVPQTIAQETTDISPTTTSPQSPNKGMRKQIREAAKEQRVMLKEQRKEIKAEFKEKLSKFKDTRKQNAIQNIDQKLSMINAKRTSQMSLIVTKLEGILARIKEKSAALKANGGNTTNLDAAISQAQIAITTAKTNVSNQAAKQYTINLTTETQAKAAVGQTVSGMQADLRNARQSLIAAKQAVMKAATELAKAKSTITPTATQ